MSTETGPDRPPQRTVAELLAAHGGGQPTSGGRRARRDAAEEVERPSRHVESRSAAPRHDGGQHARPPAGEVPAGNGPAPTSPAWTEPAWGGAAGRDPSWDAAAGNRDGHSDAGWPGGQGDGGWAGGQGDGGWAGGQGDGGWAGGRRDAGWSGGQPTSVNHQPEPLPDWRAADPLSAGPVAPARQPDARWRPSGPDPRRSAAPAAPAARDVESGNPAPPSAGSPPRQSRRELREAREAGLGQLDAAPPLPGDIDGRVEGNVGGRVSAAGGYQAPPAQRTGRAPARVPVEPPTDAIPLVTEPVPPNDSNGHRAPSIPTHDHPAPPRQRARMADAGPATGAISPEALFDDDDDGKADEGADDVKILGRSPADFEAAPGTDGDEDATDPAEEPKLLGKLARRRTKPKRGSRRRSKRKSTADVELGEDEHAPDAPAADGDLPALNRGAPTGFAGSAPDVPAGLFDSDELASAAADASADPEAEPDATVGSPAKAWLVIIAQLVAGAVAGAALWVGFRWLWGKMPPLALGAAVLAMAGSVVVVRAIRRSNDLRTSLFAVLMGLVVTVSPAVLVLVSR